MIEAKSTAWSSALKKIVYDRNNEYSRTIKGTAFSMFHARSGWQHDRQEVDLEQLMNVDFHDDDYSIELGPVAVDTEVIIST